MTTQNRKGYSTIDVAQMLGVTVQTVQRWVDAGHFTCWRTVGGHRRIDADSVHRFKEVSGMVTPAPPVVVVPPEPIEAPPPPANDAPSVLIVEDDPSDREMVAYLIRRLRPTWRIEFAENGFSALLAIGRRRPNVLITDVAMPYLNGPAMLKTIFAAEENRGIAVLAVSSHSTEEIRALGGLPPGVSFLHKPLNRNALERFFASVESSVPNAAAETKS